MRISDWSSDVCSSDLVHQPQAVAVAVEGDAEVAALPQHGFLKLPQVLGHRGIGMVIGKAAVDLRIEQDVFAGKARGDRSEQRRVGTAIVSTGRARFLPYH